MYNSNNIANTIKLLAKKRNVSVKNMLSDIGLGLNTMSNLKTSMPKADNLAKIADYLDCSVDYLLGRTDETNFSNKKRSTSDLTEAELECLDLFCQLTDIDKGKCLSEMEHILKRYPLEKQEWIS